VLAQRSPSRPAARLVTALALAAAALLLAGCAQVAGTARTIKALNDMGIRQTSLNVRSSNGTTTVELRYRSEQRDEHAFRDEVRKVEEVVWKQLPVRFDVLDLRADAPALSGGGPVTPVRLTRAELQEQFGPRPAGKDRDVARSLLLGFAAFALVILLLVALVVLVIVLLVRRGRSRPAPPAPGWGPPPPGQGS
jgi:hypothetical protein